MVEGIKILSSDERPSISRGGKPTSMQIITVETDFGATGTIEIPKSTYAKLAADPAALAELLEAKRDELNAIFMV